MLCALNRNYYVQNVHNFLTLFYQIWRHDLEFLGSCNHRELLWRAPHVMAAAGADPARPCYHPWRKKSARFPVSSVCCQRRTSSYWKPGSSHPTCASPPCYVRAARTRDLTRVARLRIFGALPYTTYTAKGKMATGVHDASVDRALLADLSRCCKEGLTEELGKIFDSHRDILKYFYVKSQRGQTLLHEACEADQADTVQLILLNGVPPDIPVSLVYSRFKQVLYHIFVCVGERKCHTFTCLSYEGLCELCENVAGS